MATVTKITARAAANTFTQGDIVYLASLPTTLIMVTSSSFEGAFGGTVIALGESSIYSLGDTCSSFANSSFRHFIGVIEIESNL